MRKQTDYLTDRLADMDDEAFADVVDAVSDKAVKVTKPAKDGIIHITDMEEVLAEIEAEKGQFIGESTGYKTLDKKMGGLEPGSLVIIGGETSNGKSMLALNMAINVAQTMSNILYISLEMTQKQVLKRISLMLEAEKTNITEDLDFAIQKSYSIDYKDLEPLVKNARENNGCEVVFIDYLQYLGRGMHEKEVAIMSKQVKQLAQEYNICMVVIVSLRKSGADAKSKRKWTDIEVEDLMGTAAIGYDADTVVIASRRDTENKRQEDKFYVKVLKTRNGWFDFNNPYVELNWNKMRISEDFTLNLPNLINEELDKDGFATAGSK